MQLVLIIKKKKIIGKSTTSVIQRRIFSNLKFIFGTKSFGMKDFTRKKKTMKSFIFPFPLRFFEFKLQEYSTDWNCNNNEVK